MNIIRRILVLHLVLQGLQRRALARIQKDVGLNGLGDCEVNGEETKEGCPEQHRWRMDGRGKGEVICGLRRGLEDFKDRRDNSCRTR